MVSEAGGGTPCCKICCALHYIVFVETELFGLNSLGYMVFVLRSYEHNFL